MRIFPPSGRLMSRSSTHTVRRRRKFPRHLIAERLESRAMLSAGHAAFQYSGGPQGWEIPDGVKSASVRLVGGLGGADDSGFTYNMPAAHVQGTLTWPAGTTALDVWVGGNGANATGKDSPGAGGFNGAAQGGTGSETSSAGGGGGGATDIRIDGYLPDTRVMVAGGSGGAGGSLQNGPSSGGVGGDGGTGGAGTATAGVWPAGNGATGNGDNPGKGGAGGQVPNGQSTVGGNAGTATNNGGGGGGASGYFGGDGGKAGTSGIIGDAGPGGGGGGGSSYADPALITNAAARVAYNIFSPSATIDWVHIGTASIGPLQVDTATQQQLVATFPDASFTPTWEVTHGSLPAGLSLSSAGELSGTPTDPGHYSFTVTVTAQPNAVATSVRTYTGSVESTVPGTPTDVLGQAGYESVALTWTAPTTTGGEAIDGYAVRLSTDGGFSWTVATPNTFSSAASYTVTGLTSSSGYQFEVAAINGVGTGPWSAASRTVVPEFDPGAPVGLIAVAGDASATLSWQPPADSGGSITGYRIEAEVGSTTIILTENTGTTATTYEATGLVNGVSYRFQVAAINEIGSGPFSALSNAVIPAAPSSVVAVQVLDELVITVNGGATAYMRTNLGRIEVAANRSFSSAQQFEPATVTDVIVSGNTGAGGFVFTTGTLVADIEMAEIGSIAFETGAVATGTVQAAIATGPLVVSSAIRGLGGVTLDAAVRLVNDVEIDGGTGSVTVTGTVDGQSSGEQSLTVTALGSTIFEAAIGAAVPLERLETRAVRPLVLSSDSSQSRTIPLHYLPYTTPGGNVEDKYGIEVAIGNNPARMYEFDTGGTGFWAGYNPEWWQGVVPSANATVMENKYTSGNYFDGLATTAVLTLGSGAQTVSTGGAVQITAITAGGNSKTGAAFDFSTASAPPIEGHFFGDFGASFGIAKPPGGQVDPPVQVTNPLLQLPGNLSSGFVVQLGPLGTSPRVVVGITDELRGQFPTAIPLTEIDGLLYPNPNGAAFQRQAYEQFAFSGEYSLSRDGGASTFDLGTIETLIDSGAPTMTIHYPVHSRLPGDEFVSGGMVTNGTTFTGLFPLPGATSFDWSFVAGSEASVDAIDFTTSGSAASTGNSVNTGLNFYNGYDVMFDVATGYLRVRPSGGLSSVQLESVTTLGSQRYGQNAILSGTYTTGGGEFFVAGATTLAGAVTVSAGTGAVTFSGTVDSAAGGGQPLTVESSSQTEFVRPVGATRPLASLSTDAGGTSAAVSVTTAGPQRFGDATTLAGIYTTHNAIFSVAGDTTLTGAVTIQTSGADGDGSGGPIQFTGRIDSRVDTAFPLSLDAGDDTITVAGAVGASRPLGGIAIASAQTASFATAVHLDGSGFGAAADGLVVADQVTVRLSAGGSIRRFTGSGVVFDRESQHSHLRGFEITDNVYDGIQIAAKSAGGTITYSGTVIEGNTIHGNGAFGIEVAGPVRGLTIHDNTIGREGATNPWDYVSNGPNTHGVVLAPGSYSGTLIKGNSIRFNRRSGIMLPGGVQGVAITNNTIEHNSAHGIEAATGDFTGTTVTRNTIRNNGGDGISLGAGIGQGVTTGGNPQEGYSAAVGHYLLPYANSPNFYDPTTPPADPQIAMQVGTKKLAVNLDTGSRGLYFDALQLDTNIALDGPKGHVYLNSSNRLYFGQWSNQTITFTQSSYVGAGKPAGSKATANVPVLVVTAIGASTTPAPGATVANTTFGTTIASGSITITDGSATRTVGIMPNATGTGPAGTVTIPGGWWATYADNMLTATTSKLAPVANFGIGFDRTGQGTAPTTGARNQLYNAFLNLTEMQRGSMRPGYVISAEGVKLGLDSSVSGFASTDLAPTGLPQQGQSAPDWQPATGTVTYESTTSGTGQIVIDMGIPSGILTLPGKTPSSKFSGMMTVNLLNANGAVQYDIDTSDSGNLLNPTEVDFFNPLAGTSTENLPPQSSQFFNTGRRVFAAFDYLYDAAAGLLGLKVGSTTNAQNAFADGRGQFTAAHYPNPNAPVGVTNLRIGGDSAWHGNAIADNRGTGVAVNGTGSVGNQILSNLIFANTGGGIVLANGSNADQTAPTLTGDAALRGERWIRVSGTAPTGSGLFTVQFFASPGSDATDPVAVQGRRLLGTSELAAGQSFTVEFPVAETMLTDWITATATSTSLNTSEFSSAVRVTTLIVDSTADAGTGSLRNAITMANAAAGRETILFELPVGSSPVIALTAALPQLTSTMVIDGQTSGVTISGAAIPGAADGLRVGSSVRVLPPRPGAMPRPVSAAGPIWGPVLSAPATEIRSLAVTGFSQGSGIVVAAAATVENVSVTASSIGISLVGARAAVVRTSSITNSLSWGLYAAGSLAGSSLTGNTVSGSGLLGIYLDNASGLSVTANTASGGTAKGLYSTGIYVGGQSAGTTITDNASSGNGNGLLLVDAQGATIERNQFISNRGFGVLASGNSTGTTLRGNTISGNGRNTSLTRAFGLIGSG